MKLFVSCVALLAAFSPMALGAAISRLLLLGSLLKTSFCHEGDGLLASSSTDHRRLPISTTPDTALNLANALAGAGVNVVSATLSGAPEQAGTFTGAFGAIGIESGVVLSTGNIANAIGPDNSESATSNTGSGGFQPLSNLIGGAATYDAAVLTIEFECEQPDGFSFKYVFGSEEYSEYVDSAYNDVFAFFKDGLMAADNLALVEGSPVSINTVNCGNPYDQFSPNPLCGYFVYNDGSLDTQMDGFTVPLYVNGTAVAGTNVITIAIADTADSVLDSFVFIQEGSLTCSPPPPTCTTESCQIDEGQDAECASASCSVLDVCVKSMFNDTVECTSADDSAVDESKNSCYQGKFCDGYGNCVLKYASGDCELSASVLADPEIDEQCVDGGICVLDENIPGRTSCQPKFQPNTTECQSDADILAGLPPFTKHGDCHLDGKNKCDGNGKCKPVIDVGSTCRNATGCCDEEEVCSEETGVDCPDDVFKPFNTTCRPSCGGCEDEPSEVCSGDSPFCPIDIVFEQEMCVYAGKSTDVGTVVVLVTRTPLTNGQTEYRLSVYADLTAPLATGSETIKFELTTSGAPKSSPGSYTYKLDLTSLPLIMENLLLFTSDGTCTVDPPIWYFAFHFDMADGNTAWALPCDNDADSYPDTFQPSPFTKTTIRTFRTRTGKKKTAKTTTTLGWGNYWTYEPCCKDLVNTCPDTCNGGGVPEKTGTRGLRAFSFL